MYKIVIIEDEKYAAHFLQDMLGTIAPDMEVVGILESNEEARHTLPLLQPDLILADIHLEDGLSFSTFENLQWKKPVIFITAYDAYAIRAFKVNGIDYLLKPCDEEELTLALDKFRNTTLQSSLESLYERISRVNLQTNTYKERFAITLGSRLLSISVAEIAFFSFSNKTTWLVKKDGQKLPYTESLDNLLQLLNPSQFFRINRNYLISHDAIDKIETHAGRNIIVHLKSAAEDSIQVSKDRIVEFKCWLDK